MAEYTEDCCFNDVRDQGGVMDDQSVDTLEAEIERLRQQVAAAKSCPDLLARLVRPWHSGPSGDQGLNDPLHGTKETTMSNDIPYEYTTEGEAMQEVNEALDRDQKLRAYVTELEAEVMDRATKLPANVDAANVKGRGQKDAQAFAAVRRAEMVQLETIVYKLKLILDL